MQKQPAADLEAFFEPIFVYFQQNRESGESFGVFCDRVGFDAIRQFSESYELGSYKQRMPTKKGRKIRYRVGVHDPIYERLKQVSKQQGKSMTKIVAEALEAYFDEDSKQSVS